MKVMERCVKVMMGWCEKVKGGGEGCVRMVCEGDRMFNLHIIGRLLENRRKT